MTATSNPPVFGPSFFFAAIVVNVALAVLGVFTVGSEAPELARCLAMVVDFAGMWVVSMLSLVPMGEPAHTTVDTINALIVCTVGVGCWTAIGFLLDHLRPVVPVTSGG